MWFFDWVSLVGGHLDRDYWFSSDEKFNNEGFEYGWLHLGLHLYHDTINGG